MLTGSDGVTALWRYGVTGLLSQAQGIWHKTLVVGKQQDIILTTESRGELPQWVPYEPEKGTTMVFNNKCETRNNFDKSLVDLAATLPPALRR